MAEHHSHQQRYPTEAMKSQHPLRERAPSTSKVLALLTLFPLGGLCLLLAGITLTGTFIGLAVATPLLVIFSPILVPAALTIGLAVTGFLTSGAFGITALSSLSYIINYLSSLRGGASASASDSAGSSVPEHLEYAKRRAQDSAGYVGQKIKDMGQKTQDAARS